MPGPGPVIWINGFPGTGKLTIARELAHIKILSILIDNHKLIDRVQAKFPRDHPQYQIERKRRRQWAFEHFVFEPTRLSETVIFTDFQSDNELGQNTAQEYCEAAQKAGGGGANGCLIYSFESGSSSSSYVSETPTAIGQDRLRIQFGEQYKLQSLTDDNVSAINVVANFTKSKFSLNTTFQPRGSLLFNGGSGSFFWGSDFNQGWASPAAYTTGIFTINGKAHTVDSKRSTTWYDRQWGDPNPTKGWHWIPIQLDNGIRISTWVLPTDNGSAIKAFATALYPNGRQEVVSVKPDIKPNDPWVSSNTNRTWFGSFEVSFLDECYSVIKAVSPNVTTRHFGEANFGAGFAFCDSFMLYSGTWKGEKVSGWGVVEQWPAS
ncbi:hypothetical protein GGI43DRAFT_431071 [Trichoderma evansii]